jgi:glycosyltransferase involved in cell wall biosynthesis
LLVSSSRPEAAQLRVAYLAVEAPREGHATFAHVHEIVGGLRRQGIVVELFSPSQASLDRAPGIVGRLLEQLRVQARLLARWRHYDAIYVRAHYTAFPTAVLAKLTGRPLVQEVNGPFADVFIAHPWTRWLRPLLTSVYWLQLVWAKAVITVTPSLRTWIERQADRHDVDVIPNAANLALFSPDRLTTQPLPGRFVVFFGSLTAWQGVETLVAALERPEWPDDLHLVILGDGRLRDVVAAAAARHSRLHWLGRVPYAEVGGIVARAIAGLVPKNAQGDRQDTGLFPLKLFEILACGVPVVVTDFPGQADFVREHDCGLVIPPESPAALAGAVRTLAAAPERSRTMGDRGRTVIMSAHTWTHRADDTARVLRRVSPPRPIEQPLHRLN